MRIALYSSQVSTPPPPPPPPPHKVQAGETVQSVAKVYHVTPQAVAHTNHITVDATLHAGQVLQLPANAFVTEVPSPNGAGDVQTPQQKTDAAAKAYQQALKDRDDAVRNAPHNMGLRSEIRHTHDANVESKRVAFDKAVKAEVASDVNRAKASALKEYQAIPPQVRRAMQAEGDPLPHVDEQQAAAQATTRIVNRYQADPTLSAAAKGAGHAYQVDQKAESLIPYDNPSTSAADKLKDIDLKGQPQEVVDAVMNDPRVQGWIKQAVADVGKPYDSVDKDKIPFAVQNAIDASSNLYRATDNMSPAMAAAVVTASMPTIRKIADLQLGYTGTGVPASTLQDVMGRLGNGSQAQALISQIAGIYADRPGAPGALARDGSLTNTAFGIELARQVAGQGRFGQVQATEIMQAVEQNAGNQQNRLKTDIKNYAELTGDLNWYIKNLGPSMTPAQLQTAIQNYENSRGQGWKDEVAAAKSQIVADARQLNDTLTALNEFPPELSAYAGDAKAAAASIGGDGSTQEAIEFAAAQDPGIFAGETGENAAKFWVEVGHKGKDFADAVAKAYVAANVLPELKQFNPNNAASVAAVRQQIADLRDNPILKVLAGKELGTDVGKLEDVIASLKTESIQDAINGKGINALGDVEGKINELPTLSSGPAGLLFRTIAFGLSGAALTNSASELGSEPKLQNLVGTLGLAIGFPKDTAALATQLGLPKSSSLGSWGLGESAAGEATEKFLGALGTAYYVIGGINALSQGDYAGMAFNAAAAAGIGVATFVDTSWAGPVGWGVALVATIGLGWYGHVQAANHFQDGDVGKATVKFLEDAGFSQDAAKALSDESGNGYSPVPLLVQYAKDKGYNMSDPAQRQQVVAWVNGMSSSELSAVRDWMHHTLDDFHGDVGKLGTDATPVWPTTPVVTIGAAAEVHVTPHTVGAMDGMMKTYGVTPLPVA